MAIELLQVSECFTLGAEFSRPEVLWNLRCRGASAHTVAGTEYLRSCVLLEMVAAR